VILFTRTDSPRCASRIGVLIGLAGLLLRIAAESGMCLVAGHTGGSYVDYNAGEIRRIDLINNVPQTPTAPLGTGCFPRFAPGGDEFAYISGSTVKIVTLNGGAIRNFTSEITCDNSQVGNISWTDGGIWIGGSGVIVKYDTLGALIKRYTGNVQERNYVSRNEITGAGVNTDDWSPYIYNMRRNTYAIGAIPAGGTQGGCSACPSPDGTMLTNNLTQNSVDGTAVDGHRSMRILDTLGHMLQYLRLENITQFTDLKYRCNTQCWSSNSNDWIVLPVGEGHSWDPDNNLSPCIYNINTREKFCLKDNSGTNIYWQPYDYYSGKTPGGASVSLQLSATSLAFSADSGAANPPTQTVTASTASGSLSGLAVSGAKAWITATPAAASGASIVITNTVNIAGLAPGIYLDTITVNTGNAGSKTYAVTLTVRRPAVTAVLTSMTVSPAQYTVAAGSSVSFLTTCKDQSGKYFTTATITWNVSGGGSVDQYGAFTATAAVTHGPHRLIATAAAGGVTLRDTAWIMVSRAKNASIHKRIDCGANSYLPAGWVADDAYRTGGSDFDLTAAISTANVPAAAPANVYKSVRRGNPHSYRITGLPAQFAYTTRLHLVDWKDTTRLMSFSILGTNVLRDFGISSVAGGANKPLVLDFTDIANDTLLPISCSAASGDVFEAGFEVIQNFLKPVTLLSPLGGKNQVFAVGQQLPIQFRNDTLTISQMFIQLSVNGGQTYINFTGAYGIFMADMRSTWGNYAWTIPDSIDNGGTKVSTVSTTCRILVKPYNNIPGGSDYSDSNFTIVPRAAVLIAGARNVAPDGLRCAVKHGRLMVRASSSGAYRIDAFSVMGNRLWSAQGIGAREFSLARPAGVVMVRMITAAGKQYMQTVKE